MLIIIGYQLLKCMVMPVILAPAESVMPWDLFIYKATLLAVVDLQYTLSYCTIVSSLYILFTCMHDCAY